MRFVIFSGTTEGRKLSALLAEAGAKVTVCVASDYGSEEQGEIPGVETRTGSLSPEEKRDLLRDFFAFSTARPDFRMLERAVREGDWGRCRLFCSLH